MGALEDLSNREDLVSGKEAFERFDALLGQVLSVPRKRILERHAKHKATVHLRGKKRGPKPRQRDAGRDPAE